MPSSGNTNSRNEGFRLRQTAIAQGLEYKGAITCLGQLRERALAARGPALIGVRAPLLAEPGSGPADRG